MNAVAAAREALQVVVSQLGRTESHLLALVNATLAGDIDAVVAATAALDATARGLDLAAAAAAVAAARRDDAMAATTLNVLIDEVKRVGQRVQAAQRAANVVVGGAREFHGAYLRALTVDAPAAGGAGYTRRATAQPMSLGSTNAARA